MSNEYIPNYKAPKVYALIGGKAVVFNKKGKILLIRRSVKTSRAGGWDLPGGAVDKGEDPIKSIVRETKEETGIEIFDVVPVHVISYESKGDFAVIVGYSAHAKGEKVILSWEHDEYKWVTKEEALKIGLPDIHRSFVEKALI